MASQFGYKLSANADKRYQLIRKIEISTACKHDTLQLEAALELVNSCDIGLCR